MNWNCGLIKKDKTCSVYFDARYYHQHVYVSIIIPRRRDANSLPVTCIICRWLSVSDAARTLLVHASVKISASEVANSDTGILRQVPFTKVRRLNLL